MIHPLSSWTAGSKKTKRDQTQACTHASFELENIES